MGLIKAKVAPTKVSAFSMSDIEAHALTIIDKARVQADRLLQEAQELGDKIRAERYEQGYADGRSAGLSQGLEAGKRSGHAESLAKHSGKLEALVSALSDASQKLEVSRRKLESETVHDVIRLAVAIARRVTKKLGDSDPGVARANVLEALRMVINASQVKVALHPSQLEMMNGEMAEIKSMFPKLENLELVPDPSLSPGGCRLLAGSGMVDADLDTQLDRVVADLLPPGSLGAL